MKVSIASERTLVSPLFGIYSGFTRISRYRDFIQGYPKLSWRKDIQLTQILGPRGFRMEVPL